MDGEGTVAECREHPCLACGEGCLAAMNPDATRMIGSGSGGRECGQGPRRLREAQVTHHAVVRDLYPGRLTDPERQQLARLLEKALPGVVSEEIWPSAER